MTILIKKITRRWSAVGTIDKSDEDVYEYGLELLIYTIINIAVILGSSILVGKLLDSLFLLVVILPLQSFGGGYHAKTHLRCFLIMYIGWWAVIFILPLITPISSIIIACTAVFIVFWIAPVAHENVRISVKQKNKMRLLVRITAVLSAIITACFVLSMSECIGIAMSTGLGIASLSMLIAHGKNILNGM